MARQSAEGILEKKVAQLREAEKEKRDELARIAGDLRRYEAALESLKGNIAPRKRRKKEDNGLLLRVWQQLFSLLSRDRNLTS
jgi:hypothetical protein